jgi:hypothetical protein
VHPAARLATIQIGSSACQPSISPSTAKNFVTGAHPAQGVERQQGHRPSAAPATWGSHGRRGALNWPKR